MRFKTFNIISVYRNCQFDAIVRVNWGRGVVAMKLIRSIDRKVQQSKAAHAHTLWKLRNGLHERHISKTDSNLIECLFWERTRKNQLKTNNIQHVARGRKERKRVRERGYECGRTRPRANDTRALSIGSSLPAQLALVRRIEPSTSARCVVLCWIHSPSLARRVHNDDVWVFAVCVTKAARYECSLCFCVLSVLGCVCVRVCVRVCCVLRLPFVAPNIPYINPHSQRNHF